MAMIRACAVLVAMAALAGSASAELVLKDTSLDRPLVLDENLDYQLQNVSVTGLSDCAALTLTGTIASVHMDRCTFGRVYAGSDGKALALEAAGAMVGRLSAKDCSFFDAENQLAMLKEGSFGKVTFERCHFTAGKEFLKEIYRRSPWRSWPPVTEFHNIQRLELLDNEYANTTVIIHPSVKQVVLRGDFPGMHIINREATRVFYLEPGQTAQSIPDVRDALAAR